jgi:hypothetical protein
VAGVIISVSIAGRRTRSIDEILANEASKSGGRQTRRRRVTRSVE